MPRIDDEHGNGAEGGGSEKTSSSSVQAPPDKIESDITDDSPKGKKEKKNGVRSTQSKRPKESNPTYMGASDMERDLNAFRRSQDFAAACVARGFRLRGPDLEDLSSTVFLKSWRRAERVPIGRGQRTWLSEVTRNAAVDAFRANKPYVFVGPLTLPDDNEHHSGLNVWALRAAREACVVKPEEFEIKSDLHLALKDLASTMPLHLVLLLLNAVGGYSVRDIAKMVGFGKSKVSTMIKHIKKEFKARYPELEGYIE